MDTVQIDHSSKLRIVSAPIYIGFGTQRGKLDSQDLFCSKFNILQNCHLRFYYESSFL